MKLDGRPSFPLLFGFKSNRESSSPYLGKGWTFALLESRFVQTSENIFEVTLPDGSVVQFTRSKESESTIHAGTDWIGEIGKSEIKISASCGWSLVFKNGLLTSITTPTNQKLTYNYNGKLVTSITDQDSRILLNIVPNVQGNGDKFDLDNGTAITTEKSERPTVQFINGKGIISGTQLSLSKVATSDMAKKEFIYSVTDKVEPTLKTAEQTYVWGEGGKIRKDRYWNYTIVKFDGDPASYKIKRSDIKDGTIWSFWHYDIANAEETLEYPGSESIIRKWFSSGVLTGKTRSIEKYLNGKLTDVLYKAIYDQNGHLIRKLYDIDNVKYTTIYSKNKIITYKDEK